MLLILQPDVTASLTITSVAHNDDGFGQPIRLFLEVLLF